MANFFLTTQEEEGATDAIKGKENETMEISNCDISGFFSNFSKFPLVFMRKSKICIQISLLKPTYGMTLIPVTVVETTA